MGWSLCGSVAVLVGCCWLAPFCRLLWVVCCGPVAISVEGRLLCVGYFASVALCRLLCVGRFVLAVVGRSPWGGRCGAVAVGRCESVAFVERSLSLGRCQSLWGCCCGSVATPINCYKSKGKHTFVACPEKKSSRQAGSAARRGSRRELKPPPPL